MNISPPVRHTRIRTVSPRRLTAVGVLVAIAVGAAGFGLELRRFGRDEAAAARHVQARVRATFSAMTASLQQVAGTLAASQVVRRGMAAGADDERARALFDQAGVVLDADDNAQRAVTIYDPSGTAKAWAGRPSEIPTDRITGPAALFVIPSPLGLRLVYVQPIVAGPSDTVRLGSVAVEQALSPAPAASTITATDWVMPTAIAPVSLRTRVGTPGPPSAFGTFAIRGPDGGVLLEAAVTRADLAHARALWRRRVVAAMVGVLGLTLLLLAGPLLDRRGAARRARAHVGLTAALTGTIAAGCVLLWGAGRFASVARWHPAGDWLLAAIGALAITAVLAPEVGWRRIGWRARRRPPGAAAVPFVVTQIACGIGIALLLVGFERLLARAVLPGHVDLRHFSLHPWSGPRLSLLAAILLWQTAILWAGALLAMAGLTRWRLPRAWSRWHAAAIVCWLAPIGIVAVVAVRRALPVPAAAVLAGAAVCALAARFGPRATAWYRRTTVASRILALFVAFLVPALLLYPSARFFTERATRTLIETRYAVQALNHPEALLNALKRSLGEIDAVKVLPDMVTGGTDVSLSAPRTESAFLIWSQTALARARLTSAVELYDRSGALVSRFALNFPEYTGAVEPPTSVAGCRWDVFGEAQPFGSEERRMLHAERNVCEDGAPVGTIVVHVVLFDYRTLPFITSQSPYFEVFRAAGGGPPPEGSAAADVETVIYGWGLRPIYSSGRSAWPIGDALFARIYRSRQPFWTTLQKQGTRWHVYLSNDRGGIYAIGYAAPDVFQHLVRLAELTTLAGAAYVVVLLVMTGFARLARDRPRMGRALLREIRASFYRKLFLAFVLASIIPVLTLALVIRAYFAGLLFADVQAEAARTAAVAQRVIEESDALLRRGNTVLAPFGDDVLVWISQVIDQDVNVFDGPTLFATSERDLFSSGLLPKRTPDDVYRAIALEHLPSFVSEDSIGAFSYMLAAAPVRAGGRDAILTVPLATRQQEIEREIDDLDRGIHLAALFFILLGAAIGLSMAERIADPVRRLTRATRDIARGDFDERIAVRSSDELRRLVDAFNSMAAELKAQRAQLERTHRIEAWAEMARQVAHEIKNPLTPIQLSAEHLQRVHADRGQPLGPVLEGCVDAILGQVQLLRQIAAEFSSFASAPTARPTRVDPVELVRGVVEPYRVGLEARIAIVNDVAGPLPAVFVDRTLVARALANLVENALHAMPGTGRLHLTATAAPDAIAIAVADTGAGMDAEALARAFEPYFSTKTTGTGLGLPIARRNIELTGGTIDVASAPGQGTTVTIRLPVAS
ncbi:MAG TPA: HAMP domain-containing sensor histidine kinase [Dehalococcoidia bacterium]|nr:HAMP domain-containing sensor histidine kinase [Dehalococcoidia bacterium]